MFRTILNGSTLTLFRTQFIIDQANWSKVDQLFILRYDYSTRQKKVSDQLASPNIESYQEKDVTDKDTLTKLVYQIAQIIFYSYLWIEMN